MIAPPPSPPSSSFTASYRLLLSSRSPSPSLLSSPRVSRPLLAPAAKPGPTTAVAEQRAGRNDTSLEQSPVVKAPGRAGWNIHRRDVITSAERHDERSRAFSRRSIRESRGISRRWRVKARVSCERKRYIGRARERCREKKYQ